MSFQRFSIFGACAVLLFLTACGSSASSSKVLSACSVISSEQISSITGIQVGDGSTDDSVHDSLCVWRTEGHPGEVAVLVGSPHSASEFETRVADAPASFGAATPVKIAGASKAVEFGDYGTVIMVVNDRLEQVQQLLGSNVSATVHRDLAQAVAAHS